MRTDTITPYTLGPGLAPPVPTLTDILAENGMVIVSAAELDALRADKARLDKVERLKLNIDYEADPDDRDIRAGADPWMVYADASVSILISHATDVRAAIDAVQEDQAHPTQRTPEAGTEDGQK